MLLRALADRIAEVTFEALPRAAVATAKEGILDTVGVTLAGAKEVARAWKPGKRFAPRMKEEERAAHLSRWRKAIERTCL